MNRDEHFMHHALRVGARHLGRTMPNPSVGCVIVKDGHVLAASVTGVGGRPHAETLALDAIGTAAKGATAYVTLEPCAHHGKTPPCAEALIKAGITRVFIAATDADPRVSGQGVAMLKAAGIHVTLLEMAHPHQGFFRRLQHGLPLVTMKIATSSDGAMHDGTGGRTKITGDVAQRHGHLLRGRSEAILTGVGTVLADDPELTCRIKGYEHPSLVRVIADRQLRTPLTSKLVRSAEAQPTCIITLADTLERAGSHAIELREKGVNIIALEELSPRSISAALAKMGISRLMVEAGPRLSNAFIAANLVDRLYWYKAPQIIGRTETDLLAGIAKTPRHARSEALNLGADTLEILEFEPCLLD
ncbi:MAG: bifunctional diaminohydroxyphosphoribosylaminopyrimidine deaminase/5-amino-6-(5-phosphoribosylamino)uracil reductase RibD [Alphaproteobacteria bacterium]|nr:bifunctional diaminohydroxyphosphoribosylaminopyrimidine deaminase/5-amino-6-(5-phosphoribosylamino)uracil reductase RibD [Alphaproteobacteria bacterium]